MRWLLNKKAQNTLEYALLISVVVGALVAMQIYAKRGIQGRLRQASDDIGSQFEPGETEWEWTTTRESRTEETNAAGLVDTYMGTDGGGAAEVTTKSGYEKVAEW